MRLNWQSKLDTAFSRGSCSGGHGYSLLETPDTGFEMFGAGFRRPASAVTLR